MKRALHYYNQCLKAALALLMAGMMIPVILQILSRHTGWIPRFIWTEEAARFCFVWIILIGSIIAVREGTHFSVDLLPRPKSRRGKGVADGIVHLAMFFLALVFAWHGVGFAKLGAMQSSEMSGINMASIYVSFPLAGISWAVFLLEQLFQDYRLILSTEPEQDP